MSADQCSDLAANGCFQGIQLRPQMAGIRAHCRRAARYPPLVKTDFLVHECDRMTLGVDGVTTCLSFMRAIVFSCA